MYAQGLRPGAHCKKFGTETTGQHLQAFSLRLSLREESVDTPPQQNWLGVREGVWGCPIQVDAIL